MLNVPLNSFIHPLSFSVCCSLIIPPPLHPLFVTFVLSVHPPTSPSLIYLKKHANSHDSPPASQQQSKEFGRLSPSICRLRFVHRLAVPLAVYCVQFSWRREAGIVRRTYWLTDRFTGYVLGRLNGLWKRDLYSACPEGTLTVRRSVSVVTADTLRVLKVRLRSGVRLA